MSSGAARLVSVGILVVSLLATAVSIPIGIAAHRRSEPGQIVIVGDPATPGMQRALDELEAAQAAGDTLQPGSFNPAFALLIVLLVLWIGIGVIIVSRQPGNWAGWLFIVTGAPFPLLTLAQALLIYDLKAERGSVPLLGLWAAFGEYSLYPIALIPLLFLLYPDGHPPSPRWRWAVGGLVGGTALAVAGFVVRPGPYNAWIDLGILYENPLGIDVLSNVTPAIIAAGTVAALVSAISSVVAVRQRFRGSAGEERQRMRVLAFVASISGASFVLAWIVGLIGELLGADEDSWIFGIFLALTAFAIVVGIPLAYLVAIFRYRLYDLDLVIRKTVQYGVVVVAFMLLGFIIVAAVPALVFGIGSGANVFPTLLFAGLLATVFLWLRPRAVRLANRFVYGKRATPYEVLSEFSERVGDTYSTDDVLPRMAQVVTEATGAQRADVWLLVGSQLRREASWPPDADEPAPRRLVGDVVDAVAGEHLAEVRHQGELLGAITLEPAPDDPMNPAKELLVRDLAGQAGLVLRNVRLIEELRASRQRLVAAQDAERRKLERNIHDGVQQQLVALTVQMRLAEQLAERDPQKTRELLAGLQGQTNAALDDLRDLARGIYPPLLADKGLAAALAAQARKAAVPTTVDAADLGRYPQDVEAAVYFTCLEALNNIAKYAEASGATITLAQRNGTLEFAVSDDGRGFDSGVDRRRHGLAGHSRSARRDRRDHADRERSGSRNHAGRRDHDRGDHVNDARSMRWPWFVWGVMLCLLAAALSLSIVNGTFEVFVVIAVMMMIGYGTVGALVASRVPHNPIGWLMLTIGAGFALVGLSDEVLTYTVITNPGAMPGKAVAAWVSNWVFVVTLAPIPLILLLFPTGQVISPRWRWVVRAIVVSSVLLIVSGIVRPGNVETDSDVDMVVANPTGVEALGPAVDVVSSVGFAVVLAGALASVVAVAVRYRRSADDDRRQIRGLTYMVGVAVLLFLAVLATSGVTWLNDIIFIAFFASFGVGIPVAIGYSILRHRLYDIDVVVKKTVTYSHRGRRAHGVLPRLRDGRDAGELLAPVLRDRAAGAHVPAGAPDRALDRRPAHLRTPSHAVRSHERVLRAHVRDVLDRRRAAPHGQGAARRDGCDEGRRVAAGGASTASECFIPRRAGADCPCFGRRRCNAGAARRLRGRGPSPRRAARRAHRDRCRRTIRSIRRGSGSCATSPRRQARCCGTSA